MDFNDIYANLSERGRLEWDLAVLRTENALLKAQQLSETDGGTSQA